jgi:hypothetical protein
MTRKSSGEPYARRQFPVHLHRKTAVRLATQPRGDQIPESEARIAVQHAPLLMEKVVARRAALAGGPAPPRLSPQQELPHQKPILEPALSTLG